MKLKITHPLQSLICRLSLALAITSLTACVANAHPYASGITNDNGTIRFILNENATNVTDSVKVAFDNNTSTNNLGPLAQGKQSFLLGVHTNYSIIVTKAGSGTFTQISVDATNNSFFGPRGVTVNRNAKNRFFGRIYVSNASGGLGVPAPGEITGRGIYILNADTTDGIGKGTNASLAGITLGSSTTYAPYKPFVGPDDKVYIADASGSAGGGTAGGASVWMVDSDFTAATAVLQFGLSSTNFGPCISTPFVTGSLAAGNLALYCNMWGYPSNSIYTYLYQYSIGGGTLPWTAVPLTNAPVGGVAIDGVNGVIGDVYIAPDGKFFAMQERGTATGGAALGNVSLWVYDTDGSTYLWDSSSSAGGNDPFVLSYGIAVSPDDQYIAAIANKSGGNNQVILAKLTNGVPDISTVTTNATGIGTTGRGIAFDAADNVYVVSGGNDRLRVFSLGLTTTAITYNDKNGTNGTFQMTIPPTSVSVVATTPQASQSGPTPGVFTLTRAGQNLNLPLTVNFNLGGTATNGVYTCSPAGITPAAANSIIFAANVTTTNITIIPVVDNVPRLTNTVILALAGGTGYSVGSPASDTIYIVNTNTPALSIALVDPQMYERTNDYARFTITRLGDTTVDVMANFTFGGTAVNGTDFYSDASPVELPPGTVSQTFKVYPINNGVYEPVNLTVTATVASGSGYNVGSPSTSDAVTIVDSDNPPETVLWSDNLQTDTSANWTKRYASTNGAPDDETVDWAYDYSVQLVPSAPHSGGDTHGLHMTVNKLDGVPAAAALNFYPNGQSFSGNYALRFDMYLIENDTASTTEYSLCGINHDGTHTNWFRNSTTGFSGVDPNGWNFDGLFYSVESDGAALGDYVGYSAPTTAGNNPTPLTGGRNASTLTEVFKSPPWTTGAGGGGAAANVYGSATPIWADVEISQINGLITWKINHTVIITYTNATPYTSGNIMLGYEDAYDSIGSTGGSVIYANARVISLASPIITAIRVIGGNVQIDFSTSAGDVPAQFMLQSSSLVSGPYADVTSTIVSLGGGNFRSTRAVSGQVQFYRIRRVY